MAKKYRYRPYRSRKKGSRNMLFFALAVTVLIIGSVYMIRKGTDQDNELLAKEGDGGGVIEIKQEDDKKDDTTDEVVPYGYNPRGEEETPKAVEPVKEDKPVVLDVAPKKVEPKVLDVKPVAGDSTSQDARDLIREALEDEVAGRIIPARDKLNSTLGMDLSASIEKKVKTKMAQLSATWLFGKKVIEGDTLTTTYKVRPGDHLAGIGNKFKIPYEQVMKLNGIKDAKKLRAGQTLKVINGPFHVKVHRSTFKLDLYLGNMYVKSYDVGLGKADNETPTGKWRVKSGGKLISPTWTDPDPDPVTNTNRTYLADDPDYPLGSRWIAIEGLSGNALDADGNSREGFAIHGTKDPESIGKRSSRGCVRLFNGEVIELYDLLVPVHSEVRIVD